MPTDLYDADRVIVDDDGAWLGREEVYRPEGASESVLQDEYVRDTFGERVRAPKGWQQYISKDE